METKVPFYNVVNIMLPGLTFIGACMLLFINEVKLVADKITTLGAGLEVLLTVAALAIAYEVGYIIFRLGGVVIEPILFKVFGKAEYADFVEAKKRGANKLDTLAREFDYAKTRIFLFVAISVMSGIRTQWWLLAICVVCVFLFTLTARGHIKKIITTVNKYLSTVEGGTIKNV